MVEWRHMNIKESLVRLGLSKNEALVYASLLKIGICQAGPLVKETKLHRMLVYEALDRLKNAGLISVVHKKNVKLFQASDPGLLLDKTKDIQQVAASPVPELRKLQRSPDAVAVRTLVGREGFITNLSEVVESAARQKNKTMCIIGGAKDEDFYRAIGDWYPEYVALLKKMGVKKKLLAPDSFSSVFHEKFAKETGTKLCTLPHGLSSPTYTRITEEMVCIELYDPSLVIIQIRNKAVARGYLDSFGLLWKSSVRQ